MNCQRTSFRSVRKDGLADDESRLHKRPFVTSTSSTQPSKNWVPGENYNPVSRFKRILHDYCYPLDPPRIIVVPCKVCKGPMKVRKYPKKKVVSHLPKVEDTWENHQKSQSESPQIQIRFNKWWAKTTSRTNTSIVPKTKVVKRTNPHHYRHHKFIKPPPEIEDQENLLVCCLHCPDPNRPWIRNAVPDHYYSPAIFHFPAAVTSYNQDSPDYVINAESRLRIENAKRLKDILAKILSKANEDSGW